ncbi:MAG TPA: ATP-binding protein [Pirellulales bacterium]|nr:ATP-binding protein [Pirellulales bacterium]
MAPTLGVSLALVGLCGAVAFCLSNGLIRTDWTPTRGRWFAAGLLLFGGGATAGGIYRSWKMTQRLRRLLHALRRLLDAAASSLGQGFSPPDPLENRDLSWLTERLDEMVHVIRRLDEQRRQSEREVMRGDQLAMVGQLAAGVAHELRNPLTSVKMLVQSGRRDGGLQNLATDDLAIIEHEIRRMEKILQQFLDFARPAQPTRLPLSLAPIASRAAALIEARARKQGVELVLRGPQAALVVDADEDQLQQLVLNLVLNALDIMPAGGTLTIELDGPSARQVELRVSDTGPGIAAGLLPRLFDPFVSTKETGIGLGLAVSHRIAANHGGELMAENLPAGGARFTLTLPASLAHSVNA